MKSNILSSLFGYILYFSIITYMTYMVWVKPEKWRNSNFMPWMSSYVTWNVFRIFLVVLFFVSIYLGALFVIEILGS